MTEVSCKVRNGPPSDDDADMNGPFWAGVIPVALTSFPPVPASDLAPHVSLPHHINEFDRIPPASRLAAKHGGNSASGGVSAGAVLVYVLLVLVTLLAMRRLEPYIGRW